MTVHVAFGIDDKYTEQVLTVMNSVVSNTKEEVVFHILGSRVEHNKFNIINYGKPNTSILYGTKPNFHLSIAACNRLFLPTALKDLKKVIYLDVDTVCLGDISELYRYKVNYIGAVKDPLFIHNAKKNKLTHSYVNTGVMVMNLEGLRDIDFIQKCVDVQDKGYVFPLLDQDIINVVLNHDLQHLPKEWNVYATIYSETTTDMMEAREHPKIVHWCGTRKPWNYPDAWRKEDWDKYHLTK